MKEENVVSSGLETDLEFISILRWYIGLPRLTLEVKNLPANAGDGKDMGSSPELRRCPREGNGNPLQYSCLGNLMDSGA